MTFRKSAVVGFACVIILSSCGDSDTRSTASSTTTSNTSIVEVETPTNEKPITVTSFETETTISEIEVTAPTAPPDPRSGWPEILVFGFIPSQEITTLQDNIDVFTQVLSEALGIEVVGTVTTDYPTLGVAMGAGEMDIGAFGPQSFILADRQYGNMELLAQSVRYGDSTYHTQYFTNDPKVCDGDPEPGTFYYDAGNNVIAVGPTDSPQLQVGYDHDNNRDKVYAEGLRCPHPIPITVIEGRTISFVSETSTSGFLVPTVQLNNAGLETDQYISIYGTGSHDSSVLNVYNGDATFGVSFNDARRNVSEQFPDVGEKVIVFNISDRIANDVVAVRRDLPKNLKDALFITMVNYIGSDSGRQIMEGIYGWTDLQRVDTTTLDSLKLVADLIDYKK
tara:strand:+ start:1342 stop:2523 length:1182 start_codon:yes stop_codon:yes gene_type:complete